MSEQYIGEIRMVGFTFAPKGWAACNGQLLSIQSNNALFSLLGTVFGGDGINTFALPDYRGRGPVGMGAGAVSAPVTQGERAGSQQVTIMSNQMPVHTHTVVAAMPCAAAAAQTVDPSGAVPATTVTVVEERVTELSSYSPPSATTGTMAPMRITVGAAGDSQPLNILNPYLGTNFIIATEGIFPSRS